MSLFLAFLDRGITELAILAGWVFYFFFSRIRSRPISHASHWLAGIGEISLHGFTLIHFIDPKFATDHVIQRAAIEALQDELGNAIHVLEVDLEEMRLDRWKRDSVPVTMLVDPRGRIRHINHGFVSAEKFLIQIHS